MGKSMETTQLGVLGAGGRMGQAIIAALADWPGLGLGGAVERAGHPLVGTPLGKPWPKSSPSVPTPAPGRIAAMC